MPLPFFSAALASWRAAYGQCTGKSLPKESLDAVVRLSIKAVADARTADTLGAEREGTGIVIDNRRGLILTIGYLVLEAGSILVMTRDGRIYPASVAGFDHGSGFGLVRVPSGVASAGVELGDRRGGCAKGRGHLQLSRLSHLSDRGGRADHDDPEDHRASKSERLRRRHHDSKHNGCDRF